MERITLADIEREGRVIASKLQRTQEHIRGREMFAQSSVQQGSKVNGIAWRFACELKDIEGKEVCGFTLIGTTARHLYAKMDGYREALTTTTYAIWEDQANEARKRA